jgi:hypothetical protein
MASFIFDKAWLSQSIFIQIIPLGCSFPGKEGLPEIRSLQDMKSLYKRTAVRFKNTDFFVFCFLNTFIFQGNLLRASESWRPYGMIQFVSPSLSKTFAISSAALSSVAQICDSSHGQTQFNDFNTLHLCLRQRFKFTKILVPTSSNVFNLNPSLPIFLDLSRDPILITEVPAQIHMRIHSRLNDAGDIDPTNECRHLASTIPFSQSRNFVFRIWNYGFSDVPYTNGSLSVPSAIKSRILHHGLLLGFFSDSQVSALKSRYVRSLGRVGLILCELPTLGNFALALPYSMFLTSFLSQLSSTGNIILNYALMIKFVFRTLIPTPQSSSRPANPRIVIIVPLRNRKLHFDIFKTFIRGKFSRIPYAVVGVEQIDDFLFNRGWLINVGMKFAFEHNILRHAELFVAQDVDMLADSDTDYFDFHKDVSHLATKASQFSFKMPYDGYFSGIVVFTRDSYTLINGYSNLYFGWGGEDDDLARRVRSKGLAISRPNQNGLVLSLSDSHTGRIMTNHASNARILASPILPGDGLTNCLNSDIGTISQIHESGSEFLILARLTNGKR